jgi:sporulation protein YlmC with PRC-barrel domain
VKLLIPLISGCVFVGALLYIAPEFVPPPARRPATAPAMTLAGASTTPELSYTRTLLGVPVRTSDGIPLGIISDFVFDPTDAHIHMVIVVAGRWYGLGGRFLALPWGLVQPAADGTALVVHLAPAPLHGPLNEERLEAISPSSRKP